MAYSLIILNGVRPSPAMRHAGNTQVKIATINSEATVTYVARIANALYVLDL